MLWWQKWCKYLLEGSGEQRNGLEGKLSSGSAGSAGSELRLRWWRNLNDAVASESVLSDGGAAASDAAAPVRTDVIRYR
jgi:hypothetical protein